MELEIKFKHPALSDSQIENQLFQTAVLKFSNELKTMFLNALQKDVRSSEFCEQKRETRINYFDYHFPISDHEILASQDYTFDTWLQNLPVLLCSHQGCKTPETIIDKKSR